MALIGYGSYVLTPVVTSSGGGAAYSAPSDGSALTDGRTGSVQSLTWTGGVQTTFSTVTLTVAVASPLDTTAPIGVVGISNCSLPIGTKVVVNGVTQRLVAGPRGEACAWWVPNGLNANSFTIVFSNDVAGSISASITAGMTWAIGDLFVGRLISLPTLSGQKQPATGRFDLSANNQTAGGQNYQLMRKVRRTKTSPLGMFTTKDVCGGSTSSLQAGSNPASKIDLNTLIDLLSAGNVCAVCDAPHDGTAAVTAVNGIKFNQSFMQANWFLARTNQVPDVTQDQAPFWSWSPKWQEAT